MRPNGSRRLATRLAGVSPLRTAAAIDNESFLLSVTCRGGAGSLASADSVGQQCRNRDPDRDTTFSRVVAPRARRERFARRVQWGA
jgi:hypothetical protein